MLNEIEQNKPKAFISYSFREQDKSFVELVEPIVIEQGFDPLGTIGRYLNYSNPIRKHMLKEMHYEISLILDSSLRFDQSLINR